MSRNGPCPSRKAAWQRILAGEGFIYLAKFGRRRIVKIGFALDPAKRMPFIGIDGVRASLVAQTPGTLAQERALHRTLRVTGEVAGLRTEYYRPSILNHPAIPAELRSSS